MSMHHTPYKTPRKPLAQYNGKSAAKSTAKAKAVDLVTGKAIVEYFFDPTLVMQNNDSSMSDQTPFKTPSSKNLTRNGQTDDDLLYSSKHLFAPCTIIKRLEGDGDSKTANTEPFQGATLVKTTDGTLHKISDSSKLIALNAPDDYVGLDDVLHLPHVTEASLLHTLRTRYKMDDIYTSAGPILISINPYRTIKQSNGESLYSEQLMMKYRTKVDYTTAKPPHLFQVADRAYVAMMDSVHPIMDYKHLDDEDVDLVTPTQGLPGRPRNQSIIISGESGAGKTEATKYIMQYLARITKKTRGPGSNPLMSPDGKMIAALEDRVLSSNPLLETFGNAQTLRNDNSSRFGKFVHIYFSTDTGAITGASISNYLLEKTRITQQVEGERNYHLFYQLLAGASPEMVEVLGLEGGAQNFNYLGNRESSNGSIDDAAAFEKTCECLTQIGVYSEDQMALLGMAAGVLHLGNVQFEEKDGDSDHAQVTEASLPSLVKACELLGFDEGEVTDAILTKNLTVNGKTIKKSQTCAMAAEKRDALAKLTYSSMFLWLVTCINETLDKTSNSNYSSPKKKRNRLAAWSSPIDGDIGCTDDSVFIGVLDIYGFECFQENGYEQLLINYCNEKLQRQFNENVFTVEQNLYTSEGIDWTYITFNDNRPCLDLIEGGGGTVGILNTLDDAWGGMGSSSEKDVKFVNQLHKMFGTTDTKTEGNESKKDATASHDYFITPKFGKDSQFIVVHFAGEVRYTVDGFVEKNMETLSTELRGLGNDSTISLVQSVFSCSAGCDLLPSPKRQSIRGVSVGSQFRTSLQNLVSDLERTQPHYIRCIKPNLNKSPSAFSSGEVLKQLRYSGMMEAIRIRREGYALREEHESFYNRFSVLLSQEDLSSGAGISHLVEVLSRRLSVTDADWQIGHTKIFLRRELSEKLERLASLRVHAAVRTIGRFGRIVATNRANRVLVRWTRFRLHMLRFYRKQRAAKKISSAYRSHIYCQRYSAIRKGVIKLQALQRCRSAQNYVEKIRDPFAKLSFTEMKELLSSEQSLLDAAINQKNFKAAAGLEDKIENIKRALEDKRPLTRKVLEMRIADAEKDLSDALERKDYSACEPLQAKIDSLVAKRSEMPTIAELKDAVLVAEEAVAAAAERRNFALAADAQCRLDEAKQRLELAVANENDADQSDDLSKDSQKENDSYGVASRAELEEQISELQDSIKDAIASKDFKKASSLQGTLDQKEALRKRFPTMQELEVELRKQKAELEDAIQLKNFAKAGELHTTIDELEEKLKLEKAESDTDNGKPKPRIATIIGLDGEAKRFETRSDLESEISARVTEISEAVATKAFQKAEELNSYVEKLEELREFLPTFGVLGEELNTARSEMDEAVSAKDFATAEKLNKTVEELESMLEKEREKQAQFSAPRASATEYAKPVAAKPRTAQLSPRQNPTANVTAAGFRKYGDAPSVHSVPIHVTPKKKTSSTRSVNSVPISRSLQKQPSELVNPVSKLRPKKPVLSVPSDTILSITRELARKRCDACLILGRNGELSGIVTDVDITRRVVAKSLDPSVTDVSNVMTPNPMCVSVTDSALDALATMIDNHFRHLPVVDSAGSVVGLLDIAKCLNDAISKLEKAETKSSNVAEDTVKQAFSNQKYSNGQALAVQALLSQIMKQAFGEQAMPTLGSILSGRPTTIVTPTTSVRDAGRLMAEHRKAALIVDGGELRGIFGFKDMMMRAVAKNLDLEMTEVASVMTEHPEFVSPDMTVLEALQTMHDHKFLTLPVCADNGAVLGVVDVIDVIHGCGGTKGWRSIFSSAMDVDDDEISAAGSAVSSQPATKKKKGKTETFNKDMSTWSESVEERPVSKLRPRAPLCCESKDSVLTVTQMLASKRGDASLVLDYSGSLAGILTDVDITRRVVARSLDANSTEVSVVMTPNPTCISSKESAMDGLSMMIENHFRHLPVVDDKGAVVGLLDIAKCLNDAISKLEKSDTKSNGTAANAMKQVLENKGAHAQALQALLAQVMSETLGDKSSPTLGSLISGKPTTIVSPDTSIRQAGRLMAESQKAALIVKNGKLTGIFGFKDMMTRAVAKSLDLDIAEVSTVMTEYPESGSPDMTVLQALQTMHDHKFLTLPVCADDGTVLGIVDVIDVINACGGPGGWRSIFTSAMAVADDDSDASSVNTYSSRNPSKQPSQLPQQRTAGSKMSVLPESGNERPVSKLRPKKAVIVGSFDSVLGVTQMLAKKRADASIIVDSNGTLSGIITDVDITRRIVAGRMDPVTTEISKVMTTDPTCVSMSDSAMHAMAIMVENGFRHLPVLDDGVVVGMLDIAKCLNDAISKLEKSLKRKSSTADDVLKEVVSQQCGGQSQAQALQALLTEVMSHAFGDQASPTLGSLLSGKRALTVVAPDTSLREAGMLMAKHRKAALIVEKGELIGIFGFKDMMHRAIARNLLLDSTPVSDVMTPNPETVSSDMTVLEAMQVMHDNRFLTLPVCGANNEVIGVVDVMDVIHACGGKDGWRSIFSQTVDMDDLSDTASIHSHDSAQGSHQSQSQKRQAAGASYQTVSKLRPKKPNITKTTDSILEVAQMLGSKRGDASIVVDKSGILAGIITDVDITRRVVARSVDPGNTNVADAMTPDPTCVSMTDLAMDAMAVMVENHFRHLPVLDENGAVVGVLDIAKCLNDAITKLEKSIDKSSSAAEDFVKQVTSQHGAAGPQAQALQAMLGQVMAQAFGNQATPTLGSLLAGKPPLTIITPDASVRDAGILMAEHRKAALIVEDGELTGIFGFKDMMTRAVAKDLALDSTPVSDVMTPNPETVSSDMTVLEAMQVMHDNRFLTLPVCDERNNVLGVVGVMDLIHACGGKDGWRSIFSQTVDMDDFSEEASVLSMESGLHSMKRSNTSITNSTSPRDDSTVARLRPKKPSLSSLNDSVLAVSQMLASKRGDASIVVDNSGILAGIITDVDITRRVVARSMYPSSTSVADVMTPDPTCVSMTDLAMDAMAVMVENHFRHLPVLDENGAVVGVLDIAKCLNDAITKLEKSIDKSSSAAEDIVKQVTTQHGAAGPQAQALQALLGHVMAQAFGNQTAPTLGSLLAGKPPLTVMTPDTSIRDAGILMAENRKAALIVEDGELTGIFGFKDMMTRAVAKDLALDSTPVSDVMTPNPETVSSDMTVLEAMQVMHDNRFLTLPVCDERSNVLGVVSVMDLIHACGGKDGWRSIFRSTLECASTSDSVSAYGSSVGRSEMKREMPLPVATPAVAHSANPRIASSIPNTIPTTLEFEDLGDDTSTINDTRVESKSVFQDSSVFGLSELDGGQAVFKIVDPKGNTHRIRCELSLQMLVEALAEKGVSKDIELQFLDDEGDTIVANSDDCLVEAANVARNQGHKVVKLTAKGIKSSITSKASVVAGVGVAFAAIAAAAFILGRPKK